MKEKLQPLSVIKVMGAYVSWVMGSGFATGQEILQFFTSYGYYSFLILAMNLVGFLVIGPKILEAGFVHRDDPNYVQTKHFCGEKLGTFYHWFIPSSLFLGMVILISGAGATLHEYYGVNHYVGALALATAAYVAYLVGFQRFVKVVGCIGPAIIAFTIFVGLVTVLRDFPGLGEVPQHMDALEQRQPTRFGFWLSGLLYISYNLAGGSMYYTGVGATAHSRREAVVGATLGTVVLMLAILLMNSAMLTDSGHTAVTAIPTLFLAKKISYVLGAVFSVILICGIFSTCSAMLWTVTEKFVPQGSRKSYGFAGVTVVLAFFLGLLPFTDLVGIIYPYLGYINLVYVACVAKARLWPATKKPGRLG